MECLEPNSDLIPDANSEAMSCAEVLGSSSKASFNSWAIMFLVASLVNSYCDLPNHICSCKVSLQKKSIQPVSLSGRFLLQQERSYSNHSHRRARIFTFLLQGSVNSVALCCSRVHRDLNFLNIQKATTLAENIDSITLICPVSQEMTSSTDTLGR